MTDWRHRVQDAEWRVIKRRLDSGDVVYALEAKTFSDAWDEFGMIDMDCAGEGAGDNVAYHIVNMHNSQRTM